MAKGAMRHHHDTNECGFESRRTIVISGVRKVRSVSQLFRSCPDSGARLGSLQEIQPDIRYVIRCSACCNCNNYLLRWEIRTTYHRFTEFESPICLLTQLYFLNLQTLNFYQIIFIHVHHAFNL